MAHRYRKPLEKAIIITAVLVLVVIVAFPPLTATLLLRLSPRRVTARDIRRVTGISLPAGSEILRSSLDHWQQTILYTQIEISDERIGQLFHALPPWMVQADGSTSELLSGLPLDWRPPGDARNVQVYIGQTRCRQEGCRISARVVSWTNPGGSHMVLIEWVRG